MKETRTETALLDEPNMGTMRGHGLFVLLAVEVGEVYCPVLVMGGHDYRVKESFVGQLPKGVI